MRWSEIRQSHPNQWLVIEALEAHTEDAIRQLDKIAVIEVCTDGDAAFQCYRHLHRQFPGRELFFVHTNREELGIREQFWIGVRPHYETAPAQ